MADRTKKPHDLQMTELQKVLSEAQSHIHVQLMALQIINDQMIKVKG